MLRGILLSRTKHCYPAITRIHVAWSPDVRRHHKVSASGVVAGTLLGFFRLLDSIAKTFSSCVLTY
jgi:hypothetical protein